MGIRTRGVGLLCCALAGVIPLFWLHSKFELAPDLVQERLLLTLLNLAVLNFGVLVLFLSRFSNPTPLNFAGFAAPVNIAFPLLLTFLSFEFHLFPRLGAVCAWCTLIVAMDTDCAGSQPSVVSWDGPTLTEPLVQRFRSRPCPLLKTPQTFGTPHTPQTPSTPQCGWQGRRGTTQGCGVAKPQPVLTHSCSSTRSVSFALTLAHAPAGDQWSDRDGEVKEADNSKCLESTIAAIMSACTSDSVDEQREAALCLREKSRDRDLQAVLLQMGILPLLLNLCASADAVASKHARTALFNISLDESLKPRLSEAVPYLAETMAKAPQDTAAFACATAYSLSVCKDLALSLHEHGAVAPFFRVLRDGRQGAKLDACKALFNLSRHWDDGALHETIVGSFLAEEGVAALVSLLEDPQSSLAAKAVLVLRNLTKSASACSVIASHGEGIPNLVALLDSGPPGVQESAAAVLLALVERDASYRRLVWEEAPMMSLEMMQSRSTPRGRQKAAALLELLSS